jgi:hypothetical protein
MYFDLSLSAIKVTVSEILVELTEHLKQLHFYDRTMVAAAVSIHRNNDQSFLAKCIVHQMSRLNRF